VRWNHSSRGLLLPEDFVPLAEECGLIRAVGEWTLERALSQAGAWHRKMPGRAWFAVNVSAPELAQGDAYVEKIGACLRANSLEGSCLELEVTEGVESEAQLRRLLALGCEEWQGHYFSAPLDAAAFETLLLNVSAGSASAGAGSAA